MPKLVAEDIPLLHSLLTDVFPGVKYRSADVGQLKAEIGKVCSEMHLTCGDADSSASQWLDKVRLHIYTLYYCMNTTLYVCALANWKYTSHYILSIKSSLQLK